MRPDQASQALKQEVDPTGKFSNMLWQRYG